MTQDQIDFLHIKLSQAQAIINVLKTHQDLPRPMDDAAGAAEELIDQVIAVVVTEEAMPTTRV